MTSPELDNLARIGKLKKEPGAPTEIEGLLRSGRARLTDAKNQGLAPESRFDLAYNAAHALALAALRRRGYRSDNRYLVFQALPHTLGLGPEVWRVLAKCHERRNAAEYEGALEIDDRLLADLIAATDAVLTAVAVPGPTPLGKK
ncbi:MAG: hypothetical protein FJX37_08225 [Alphaproteobacteria bacterium]|nr:hypothetical protein [Alphaproteobacteria bacterium]MBM3952395.1 hypothetical protein [Rhodospirillales bacterium]